MLKERCRLFYFGILRLFLVKWHIIVIYECLDLLVSNTQYTYHHILHFTAPSSDKSRTPGLRLWPHSTSEHQFPRLNVISADPCPAQPALHCTVLCFLHWWGILMRLVIVEEDSWKLGLFMFLSHWNICFWLWASWGDNSYRFLITTTLQSSEPLVVWHEERKVIYQFDARVPRMLMMIHVVCRIVPVMPDLGTLSTTANCCCSLS